MSPSAAAKASVQSLRQFASPSAFALAVSSPVSSSGDGGGGNDSETRHGVQKGWGVLTKKQGQIHPEILSSPTEKFFI